jgi:hypothetical protein
MNSEYSASNVGVTIKVLTSPLLLLVLMSAGKLFSLVTDMTEV